MRLFAMLSSASILSMSLCACLGQNQSSTTLENENVRSQALALGAQQPNTVLILDTSVGLGMQSREAVHALSMGMNVELATPADWAQKTTADFATYRAIILGDTGCDLNAVSAAQASANIWGPAVTGNVLVAANMPNSHLWNGSDVFIGGAVQFATGQPNSTGAYISLSCYYAWNAGPMTPVPLLSGLGAFTVKTPAQCYNDAHQVATHPSMTLVPDSRLSQWNCSANALFDSFPVDFQPFAILEDHAESWQLSFPDGSSGVPYMVSRGAPLSLCGNGFIDSGELCDDGNYITGDLCSEKCLPNSIVCGDWDVDLGEQCDDGNTSSGDGCSDACQWEIAPAIGACCLSGGGCMEAMSPTDCSNIGIFTADGLSCNDVGPECVGLLGACCMPQGGCLDNFTASLCNEKGGLYLNDGSTCADEGMLCPNTPVTGACCVGGGCAEMSEADCQGANGVFSGNGSICSEDTCPGCSDQPIGACCVDSACLMLSESACFLNGGMYGGDGSLCTSGTCDCDNGCCDELASGCSVSAPRGSDGGSWFGAAAAALAALGLSRKRRLGGR